MNLVPFAGTKERMKSYTATTRVCPYGATHSNNLWRGMCLLFKVQMTSDNNEYEGVALGYIIRVCVKIQKGTIFKCPKHGSFIYLSVGGIYNINSAISRSNTVSYYRNISNNTFDAHYTRCAHSVSFRTNSRQKPFAQKT